jgi:hypothetical protein
LDFVEELKKRQELIFQEMQNKQNAKVVVLQNKSFSSQFTLNEFWDGFV